MIDPSAATLTPATDPLPSTRVALAVRVSVPLMAKERRTACPPSDPATTTLFPLTATPAVLLTVPVPNSMALPATPVALKPWTKPSCAPCSDWPGRAALVWPDT